MISYCGGCSAPQGPHGPQCGGGGAPPLPLGVLRTHKKKKKGDAPLRSGLARAQLIFFSCLHTEYDYGRSW